MAEKRGQYQYNDDGSISQLVHNTNETAENSVIAVDIQARLSQTIQTHTNATVAPGTNSSSWFDCDGFDKIAVTYSGTASTAANKIFAHIDWSHDNTNAQGIDASALKVDSTLNRASAIVDTKARYFRVSLVNAEAAPITANTWVYLKA